MSHAQHKTSLGWRPHALGPAIQAQGDISQGQEDAELDAESAPEVSVEQMLRKHGIALQRIQSAAEEQLLFRKIATVAAVAGALFAAIRLSDIYFAVKARRKS